MVRASTSRRARSVASQRPRGTARGGHLLTELHLTADPGLEDLAAAELRALARRAGLAPPEVELRPFGLAGHLHVRLATGEAEALACVARMRAIHKIVRPLVRFTLPTADAGGGEPTGGLPEPTRAAPGPTGPLTAPAGLAAIRARLAELAPTIHELQPVDVRFRVTSARSGRHPFTSEDVEREAGAGVRDVLPRAVSLKQHDVEIRCDVRGETCLIGVQVPGRALSRRDVGPFRPTTTLRPSVAWCLLELARPSEAPVGRVDPVGTPDSSSIVLQGVAGGEIAPPRKILDPFVGAGTILAEAAVRWPEVALFGSDLHTTPLEGARENLGERAELRLGDARALDTVWPGEQFDTIVCNPPFGRRLGKEVRLDLLYGAFLTSAARCATDDARLVVLVENRGAFNVAIRSARVWKTAHVRVFEMGGVYVGVFVLERR